MAPLRIRRRRLLQLVGASAVVPVSGCGFAGGAHRLPGVTPAPVPTDTPSDTPSPSPAPVTADDFEFEVAVIQGFAEDHPARLEIAFRNVGDAVLTAVGERQFVLPFVDDDYAGVDGSDRLRVFLAPDDSTLRVDPEGTDGGWLRAFLPTEPDDGCWMLSFDWPEARSLRPSVLRTASLGPDEEVSHTYGLYFIDDCMAGTVTFEHTFGLATGTALVDAEVRPTRLAFDLTIAADGHVAAGVHEPAVGRPPEGA